MNLLFYTEKLAKKILFYDTIAKQGMKTMQTNPFFKPKAITVVWIENSEK